MPLYQSKCSQCNAVYQEARPVSRYQEYPECCGQKTQSFIDKAPMSFMAGRFEPFKSTVDGSIIRNKQDMVNHNARNNVVSLSDGYDDNALKGLANTNKQKIKKDNTKELMQDIYDATQQVQSGYKPTIGVYNDD